MLNYFEIDCPGCDEDLNLGAIPANQDCDFDLVDSQVCGVYIKPNEAAALPFDFTADPVTADLTAIDNTATDNSKTKYVMGEGGVAAPEKTTVTLPKKKEKISKRKYTLNLTIKNLEDTMYDFLRQIQCGYKQFTFWYETTGGRLFGSELGISPSFVDVDFVYGEGVDDVESALLILTWEAKGDPDRKTNPLA